LPEAMVTPSLVMATLALARAAIRAASRLLDGRMADGWPMLGQASVHRFSTLLRVLLGNRVLLDRPRWPKLGQASAQSGLEDHGGRHRMASPRPIPAIEHYPPSFPWRAQAAPSPPRACRRQSDRQRRWWRPV